MNKYILKLEKRKKVKNIKNLRESRIIPCIVYGSDIKNNFIVQADYSDFVRTYRKAGSSTIINLDIDGKTYEALIQHIQQHPITLDVIHVDFMKISKGHEIEADIKIEVIGTSPAVKDLGGILVQSLNELPVQCLPKDLVSDIKVDISNITEMNTAIYLKDINLPAGIKPLIEEDSVILSIVPPKEEKIEEDVTTQDVEGEEKIDDNKKEDKKEEVKHDKKE